MFMDQLEMTKTFAMRQNSAFLQIGSAYLQIPVGKTVPISLTNQMSS